MFHESYYESIANDEDARQEENVLLRLAQSEYEYSSDRPTIGYFLIHCMEDTVSKPNAFIPSATRPIIESCGLSILDNFSYLISSTKCDRVFAASVLFTDKAGFTREKIFNQHHPFVEFGEPSLYVKWFS